MVKKIYFKQYILVSLFRFFARIYGSFLFKLKIKNKVQIQNKRFDFKLLGTRYKNFLENIDLNLKNQSINLPQLSTKFFGS